MSSTLTKMILVSSPASTRLAWACDVRADLVRALEALELASGISSTDHSQSEAIRGHLIDAAVFAYWLCFVSSAKRTNLTEDDVPPDLLVVHRGIRNFRNRALAHVDSDVQITGVATIIEKQGEAITLRPPIVMTARLSLPDQFVVDFQRLVGAMLEVMDLSVERARSAWDIEDRDNVRLWETAQELPTSAP